MQSEDGKQKAEGDLVKRTIIIEGDKKTRMVVVRYEGIELMKINAKYIDRDTIRSALDTCLEDFFFEFPHKLWL